MSLTPISPALVPQLAVPANVAGPVTLRDELEVWQEAFEFAKAIAPTDLVPKEARNNPPAIMARIIKGHELGVPALHALSQIYVIEGRPTVAAELQRALILSKGHEIWAEESTITRVVLCGRRAGGDHVSKVTWTMDDAKRANLAGKSNWRTYPRAMLLARATGELARLMFADVLAGLGVNVEELTDGVTDTAITPEDTPPAAKPRTTRRTTRKSAAATPALARPGQAAPGPPDITGPGGPPPPLPDEDPSPVEKAAGGGDMDPAVGAAGSEPNNEPAEVVTKRAQSIAMRATKVGVDHHDVIYAVTHGNKTSAKDVTAAEADAVLHALLDLQAGRLDLIAGDPDLGEAWNLVEADGTEEPGESKTEEYQRRIRELRTQRAELDRGGQQTLDDQDDDGG